MAIAEKTVKKVKEVRKGGHGLIEKKGQRRRKKIVNLQRRDPSLVQKWEQSDCESFASLTGKGKNSKRCKEKKNLRRL